MTRILNKLSRYLSLTSLCLLTGSALLNARASAQSSREENSANNAQAREQFAFEVVSIRPHKPGTEGIDTKYLPNGYRTTMPLRNLILYAYIPQVETRFMSTIVNAPAWLHDLYDIDARVAPEDSAAWQKAQSTPDPESELLQSALQEALKERCKLALHITPIEVPYLDLVVGKDGAKLKETVPGAIERVSGKTSILGKGFYIDDNGKRQFVGVSMDDFTRILRRFNHPQPVQDKTGLTGRYDFTLPWYGNNVYPPGK
jgi:uncharacterized protein (TIGR03435 family)